ncbi:MAG: transporter [Gemmatimonadaceae bacterium]
MPIIGRVATCLLGSALLAGAARTMAQTPADSAPGCTHSCPAPRQSIDDAWWTGPMIAPSPGALSPGHFLIEPYFYDVKAGHANSYGTLTYLLYGLLDGLTIGTSPTAGFNAASGAPSSSGIGLGDVSGILQARLRRYHAGSWIPATAFNVSEAFPTGRYDHLGARASDGLGSGVYTTTLSLYTQSYFWLPNGRILRMRVNVSRGFSSTATVHGVSVYGTDAGFRGSATPGATFVADAAWEYSLTRSWVLTLEFNNRYQDRTTVRGVELSADSPDAGTPVRLDAPSSDAFAIAPAAEYSWTPNIGVLLAMRVIPQGHHTTRSITPVIAINILR